MALYLLIDDKVFPRSTYTDLDDASITIRRNNETGALVYGYSGDITFSGEAYKYIYEKLIAPDGKFGSNPYGIINVNVYDDCCRTFDRVLNKYVDKAVFYGMIQANALDFCVNDCTLKVNLVESCRVTEITDCIKKTYIWRNQYKYPDGAYFTDQRHPFVYYCNELRPLMLHDIILFMGLIVNILVFIITPALTVILVLKTLVQALIGVVKKIGSAFSESEEGIDDLSLDQLNAFKVVGDFIQPMNNWFTGCGYGHPSPFIRSYAENVCKICGIELVSSILNDPASPYYNTVYMYAPVSPGVAPGDNTPPTWVDENKPLQTGGAFFDMLAQVFNGHYKIDGNKLIFERRDYFVSNDYWLNLSAGVKDPRVVNICWKYRTDQKFAYARFQYTLDPFDLPGNEAKQFYNDIVDWDDSVYTGDINCIPAKNEKVYNLPIGPARFKNDGIERNPFLLWEAIANLFIGFAYYFSEALKRDENVGALLLHNGICSTAKFLILDDSKPLNYTNAKVKRYTIERSTLEGWKYLSGIFTVTGILNNFSYFVSNILTTLSIASLVGSDDNEERFKEYWYNVDYWFNAPIDSTIRKDVYKDKPFKPDIENPVSERFPYKGNEMYDRFFAIDDPRKRHFLGIEYTAEVKRDCLALDNLDFTKGVLLPNNLVGTIEDVEIRGNTMKIRGYV